MYTQITDGAVSMHAHISVMVIECLLNNNNKSNVYIYIYIYILVISWFGTREAMDTSSQL